MPVLNLFVKVMQYVYTHVYVYAYAWKTDENGGHTRMLEEYRTTQIPRYSVIKLKAPALERLNRATYSTRRHGVLVSCEIRPGRFYLSHETSEAHVPLLARSVTRIQRLVVCSVHDKISSGIRQSFCKHMHGTRVPSSA